MERKEMSKNGRKKYARSRTVWDLSFLSITESFIFLFKVFFFTNHSWEVLYVFTYILKFSQKETKILFFSLNIVFVFTSLVPYPDPDVCQLGKTTSFQRLLSPPIISLFPFCCRHHRVQLHRSIYTNWYVEVGSWQKSFVIYASRLVPSLDPLVSCLH